MTESMQDRIARLNGALEGRYRIESEIGEGGMATVYLAEDLRHERRVALKVLKPELAAVVGAERFLAEIKTTANLQHPHILPLHDSGEADGFLFFVMPYVEGDTLRDKIDRETQLPVEEALEITKKVASALHSAHERGVVHRDIKPGNILLSNTGEPTVADFGIALAVAQAGGGRATETGLSVGTPQYMSPEQASGDRNVDPRTDVYALGCVLYEMLVGEPPHTGVSAQAVLAKILTDPTPAPSTIRPSTPPHMDAVIRKALEKLPADRFASAEALAAAVADPDFRHGEPAVATLGSMGRWRGAAMALGALTIVLAVGLGWALARPSSPAPPRPVTRVSVRIPEDQAPDPEAGFFELSADGSLMVYGGIGPEGRQLWARRLDALDATPIRGSEGASGGFSISPNGREIAFFWTDSPPGPPPVLEGSIRVMPIEGGVARSLVEGVGLCCPNWDPDGQSIFYGTAAGISRIAVDGGAPEPVPGVRVPGDLFTGLPEVLPGGRGVVYVAANLTSDEIRVVDLETGEVLGLTSGHSPYYSLTGHLFFLDGGTLFSAPFDPERLRLTGPPVPLAEGLGAGRLVQATGSWGRYALSDTGTLVYVTEALSAESVTPVWVGRDGTAREIDPGWSSLGAISNATAPRLSPDGTRLVFPILATDGTIDLWVKELETGPLSRITFEGTQNLRATWSSDGRSLTFVSNRGGDFELWTQAADGTGTATKIVDLAAPVFEVANSPGSDWLVFRQGTGGLEDLFALSAPFDGDPMPVAVTEFRERAPVISPGGGWLAYVSNRSGRDEVYVRPFPEVGGSLRQVSISGGTEPLWAHSGGELFYRNGANQLVAVTVATDNGFMPGQEEILFDTAPYLVDQNGTAYDITRDDEQFVMSRLAAAEAASTGGEVILVTNFAEELGEVVPD